MSRHHPPLPVPGTPVMKAIEQSVSLASLLQVHRQSAHYLQQVHHLLPAGMRDHVKAGPVDEEGWCLLVMNNAAAAKLRQLLPALAAHLRSQGHPVHTIRVKVMNAT
jgi:hypothetical protein